MSTDYSFDELLARVAETAPTRRTIVRTGQRLLGRFDVQDRLGSGAMGQVFSVFDGERQQRVALKVLGSLNGRSIGQLKQEFRAASEMSHPNLVRLHELLVDGAEWFFTMDLVEGVTLPTLLREQPDRARGRLRAILRQLALALDALHQTGTLHRDLKPSNFLITPSDLRVVLLDFGLAHPIGDTKDWKHAGTPAYMAPEQQLGDSLTEAADWYAFGVVLYEALTDSLPQRRPSRQLLAAAPEDLRELCLALLAVPPTARPNFEQILAVVGGRPSDRPSGLPRAGPRALFGRDRELAVLAASFESTLEGRPALVVVEGPSGIGKTTLVEQFLKRARQRGALVLTGRCREREGMSYKAVDALIDHLVEVIEEQGLNDAGLVALWAPELGLLFPALQRFVAPAALAERSFESADQTLVRERAVEALRRVFEGLRELKPVVVWIDDLQWSDPESALLLAPILSGARPIPLLFIGSVRNTLSGSGPLLEALDATAGIPEWQRLRLGPLAAENAQQLALSVLPSADPDSVEVARSIAEEADGNPLFIAELAHAHRFAQRPLPPRSSSLLELIQERVQVLPEAARALMELTVISGGPVSRQVLRLAHHRGAAATESALDELKGLRLARSQGLKDRDMVDVHHDRIREIVLQGMSEQRRRQCHLDLATALEAIPGSGPEDLALHFEGAGSFAHAGPYWIAAGDRALKALAFSHAASLYERGLRQIPHDSSDILGTQARAAEALAYAGRGHQAAELYLGMAATSPDQALEFQRRAAEQFLLSGRLHEGFAALQGVLSAFGMRAPRRGSRALWSIVVGRARVKWRGLSYRPALEANIPPRDLARLDAAWTAACSLSLLDPIGGADYQNTHLLQALQLGEPRRLLRALTLEISYAATPGPGSLQRTEQLLAIASEVAERGEGRNGDGLLHLARGIAAYLQGRHEAALEQCELALNWFREYGAGAVWEIMSAQRFVIASLFFLGRLGRLGAFVPPLLAAVEESGNRYATTCFRSAYSTVAWLTRGETAEAARQLGRARVDCAGRDFDLSHFNLLVGETFLDLYAGRCETAYRRVVERWSDIERSQFLRIGVVRVQALSFRASGASLRALELRTRDPHSSRQSRLEAEDLVARLRQDPIAHGRPLAEQIEANLRLCDDDIAGARHCLERSRASFERLGMGLFAAAAQLRLGQLSAGGAEAVASALRLFEAEGVREPHAMANALSPIVASTSRSFADETGARPPLEVGYGGP